MNLKYSHRWGGGICVQTASGQLIALRERTDSAVTPSQRMTRSFSHTANALRPPRMAQVRPIVIMKSAKRYMNLSFVWNKDLIVPVTVDLASTIRIR